jgi:ABC-type lipoprotein export system ATPase subunit
MFEVKNISYSNLFENINLNLTKWLIGLYWPSGSWKTTFLNIIAWYLKPTWGEILLNKKNIYENIIHYRQTNGFSFQDYSLLNLKVKDNLDLPFVIWKNKINVEWKNYLLNYFEIEHLLNKNINEISWWEKERISIIKAFIHKPNIVFLDEAGGALDERLKKKLYSFIKEYSLNHLIFLISHDSLSKEYFWFKNIIYSDKFEILN